MAAAISALIGFTALGVETGFWYAISRYNQSAADVAALSGALEKAGGKYLYVSSAKHGGPGPGAPAHLPYGSTAPAAIVRVTEGALKADVAQALSGLPTSGLPGVCDTRDLGRQSGTPIRSPMLGTRPVRLGAEA